ncbi:MAG: hypothetical protein LGB07_05185 [Sulfurovum sp.]|nr:hypothetical protein [Sulfurovum sp.]MCB4745025.1 hypothetical protein [Sulfurovum sp.]MCB4746529.1 hypothetical protein [Sulfurovum sp.]MCB4747247.1 hypothetical protein [Sulfurovum sp.]MCB4748806.1 hypothetical protein [Sulfurovum sp.]
MFNRLKQKLITLWQLILVIAFILLEEIIWETVAKPIYEDIRSHKVLQEVKAWLHNINNTTVILVIFILMLGTAEILSIYTIILFLSGHLLQALMYYLFKIPIAVLTLWMFHTTEDKLMDSEQFVWLYGKIAQAIDWLKSLESYQ